MSAYLSLIVRRRGWALINFFCLWDRRLFEVGANSRLGFIYGKLLRHTNKVSPRFLLRDTLHEAFFTEYQEGNIIDNHS